MNPQDHNPEKKQANGCGMLPGEPGMQQSARRSDGKSVGIVIEADAFTAEAVTGLIDDWLIPAIVQRVLRKLSSNEGEV